jgi:hypothetical protein
MIIMTLLFSACRGQETATTGPISEWVSLGKTEAAEMYYSPKSFKRLSDSTAQVQFKIEFRKDTAEGRVARERMTDQTTAALEGNAVKTVAFGIEVIEVNCSAKKFRRRQQSLYADGGELIEAVPGEASPKWTEAIRGSAYELVIDQVCCLSK